MTGERARKSADPARSGAPLALSPRLRAVAALVPRGARVVDVGAGHGLLPRFLLESGRTPSCIAVERSRRAAADLSLLGSLPGLTLRFGDGLLALEPEDEGDVLVVSGLGARAILRILDGDPSRVSTFRRLVLQPQTELAALRPALLERHLTLVAERDVTDRGRSYTVLVARPRKIPLKSLL